VDRKFKREGEPDADFINCKAFGKQGEFIEKYFNKGKRIGIVGRIQTGNYTNKEGQKVYFTEVICNEVEFVDNKGESGNSTESSHKDSHSEPNVDKDGFMNVPAGIEEELPFN
jgi:single-strand DNA-binding protein